MLGTMKYPGIIGAAVCSLWLAPYAMAVEDAQGSPDPGIDIQAAESKTDTNDVAIPLTAGYDKSASNGFFIRSKDGEFQLNIGAMAQARYDVNWRAAPAGEDDVVKGLSLNRTRIYLEGQYTSAFNYDFQLNIDDEGTFGLLTAYLQYNFDSKWSVRAGQQFIAMSREDWMAPQDVATTEFSPNDFTFALGTATGIQANYQARRTRFWISLNDGTPGSKKDFPNGYPSDIAFTGRWEFQIVGRDWSVWNDLVGRRGRPRGILLGLGGGYQSQNDTSGFDRSAQLLADVSFNGNGYQAMIAGSWTRQEPVGAAAYSNYGLLVQGDYFVADHWQAYGQYNFISPGDQPSSPTCNPPACQLEPFNSITAGVSYFPFLWTNRWKFSAEAAYLFEALNATIVQPSGSLGWLASDEAGQTYFRIQAQFGF